MNKKDFAKINRKKIDFIYSRMDKRQPVMTLYLDMSKAFDYVNHEILARKLEIDGIRGNTLDLLKYYLSDRTQITQVSRITLATKTSSEKC